MSKPHFIPFLSVPSYKRVLIVDSYHPKGVMLSHWRGTSKIPGLEDDTSTGIVLNTIKAELPMLNISFMSNNHFDIDGFLGIWSLKYPDLAISHESLLRHMALLGDFRERNTNEPESDLALKLVSWMNYQEAKRFYIPFGAEDLHLNEAIMCIPKYEYFLAHFLEVLTQATLIQEECLGEYYTVKAHEDVLKNETSNIQLLEHIRLLIIETPNPLHYYALFGASEQADMVLCIYDDHRYELEYKYTTWIDTAFRHAFPRLNFNPLADKLNNLEQSGLRWSFNSIMDTGPSLRLSSPDYQLTKTMRYNHPFNRTIFSSTIPPETFKEIIISYYEEAYLYTQRRSEWTWKAMKEENRKVEQHIGYA